MTATEIPDLRHRAMLRSVTALVATYLGLSVATLIAIVILRDNPVLVNTAAWVRASFAVANAALMFGFARRAMRGAPRALLRVRIISAVVLVAIAVIVSVPGTFPLWLKIEQGACGILLLGVVVLVNRRSVR
jgi:hypothetical protein